MSTDHKRTLAVIGGGRWGRVVVSVLAQMDLPFERIVIVSRVGAPLLMSMLDRQFPAARTHFSIVPSLVDLLREQKVAGAIIVNSARSHYATATSLLEHGSSVLIEKPAVLSLNEAIALVGSAERAGVTLVPGLQYRFCRYLHRFARIMRELNERPVSFSFNWTDRLAEERYGEIKSYDASLNVAQDVMPHIWAILSTVTAHETFSVQSCQINSGGRIAHFVVTDINLQGDVTLERDAPERQRFLEFHMSSGKSLSIDFSNEPGTITVGSIKMSGDPFWNDGPRPVTQQIHHFISSRPNSAKAASDRQACLASVAFSEHASNLLKMRQQYVMRTAMQLKQRLGRDEYYALRELIAGNLIERGFASTGDNAGIERVVMQVAEEIAAPGQPAVSMFSDLLHDLELSLSIPNGTHN